MLEQILGEPTELISFNTGGGLKGASKSFKLLCDAYGEHEAYCLEDCPNAASIGRVVELKRKPYLWLLGQSPFFVSDASKLKVTCP